MKQKGNTTIIAIAALAIIILIILIGLAGFFIIIELNQRPVQPEMPVATSTEPSNEAETGTDESQLDPGEDKDNDGIPDRIQNLIDLSRIPTTTATTTVIDPSADTNNDGIPDRIENLIPPAAATPTSSPTAPAPADPNVDANNNGIPDRIENLIK